ncbi:MAG: DMT family transporter [Pseudomonadota bacterium]
MAQPHAIQGLVSSPQDNLRGFAVMLAAFFVFSGVDTIAKYLTATFHPMQIVWVRQLGLMVPIMVLFALRGGIILATRQRPKQMLRGALAGTSAACFILGIAFVPLADAVAITFVTPFLVTLLGALVLREPVGLGRWIAVFCGFLGALIVIRPGFGSFHPAMLLIVAAAFAFALRQIVSRALSAGDPTVTTVAYTALVSSLMLTVPLPFFWAWPEAGWQVAMLCAVAAFAGLGEFLLIRALEIGQAAALAPSQYSLLIWGSAYGWFVFGDWPDQWTWLGATIIIASGLYATNLERLAARRHPV